MSTFQYRPLSSEEIRVLKLLPGQLEDPLSCELQHVQLSSPPTYEALSYCWGDGSLTRSIISDGSEMKITETLYSALCRMRHKDRPRILWADAICINQEDKDEKTCQVGFMTVIYSHAAQVNVWLGSDDEWSKTLGKFIPQVHEARKRHLSHLNTQAVTESTALHLRKLGLPNRYDWRYLALSALVNRPWFNRVWIVQELAKSGKAEVYCGDWIVPWRSLIEAANWVDEIGIGHAVRLFANEGTPTQNQRFLQLTDSNIKKSERVSLLTLLIRHRHCLSSDPRDKIFALCELAYDSDIVELTYRKSTKEVYLDTAIGLVQRYRTLEVVTAAGLPPKSFQDGISLPTWVPDWTRNDVFISLLAKRTDGTPVYPANSAPWQVQGLDINKECGTLTVTGMLFDRVDKACSPYRARHPLSPGYQERTFWTMWSNYIDTEGCLIEWQEVFKVDSGADYIGGSGILDAFWQTMCAGSLPYKNFDEGKRAFEDWDRMPIPARILGALGLNYRTNYYKVLAIPLSVATGLVTSVWHLFRGRKPRSLLFQQMASVASGRRMVSTSTGYLALAPSATEVGDHVALIPGSGLPLFLRAGANEGRFSLVGEGYVHGIMNGEGFREECCIPLCLE
ncbi:uncharacterized protein A1O5_03024 [Cladophialophora psammophila CBS 110553]|uniref:Heterokaryon incompatibility domain-containing protein n=1 Tax=Cladophialophora psammophila CBS 110553 TaxID=1182543 RepID=W9XSJ0_9EURO|nr:uncharacterized protein A1O5_03024 [Cladophialophora psammophila CBS 110553]EXJ73264.1 hypothetical protein A1O5_03024 [Cladophialophora psammophila CBS 110553]